MEVAGGSLGPAAVHTAFHILEADPEVDRNLRRSPAPRPGCLGSHGDRRVLESAAGPGIGLVVVLDIQMEVAEGMEDVARGIGFVEVVEVVVVADSAELVARTVRPVSNLVPVTNCGRCCQEVRALIRRKATWKYLHGFAPQKD